ncbi:hypothetical protein [Ralstonia sp. SA306]
MQAFPQEPVNGSPGTVLYGMREIQNPFTGSAITSRSRVRVLARNVRSESHSTLLEPSHPI